MAKKLMDARGDSLRLDEWHAEADAARKAGEDVDSTLVLAIAAILLLRIMLTQAILAG